MKQYYECHITCKGDPQRIEPYVRGMGWTFSAIDGDPDLGAGVKCYATKQLNAKLQEVSVQAVLEAAADVLRMVGVVVTREKIEVVIFDKRSP